MDKEVLLFFSSQGFSYEPLHEAYHLFRKEIDGVPLKLVVGKVDETGVPQFVRFDYNNRKVQGIVYYQKIKANIDQVIGQIKQQNEQTIRSTASGNRDGNRDGVR